MTPVQLAPMLAVYEDEGEFTLRISDSPLAKIVSPQVIKAIGESVKARKLTLITPTDTKVFKFDAREVADAPNSDTPRSEVARQQPSQRQIPDTSAPPSAEAAAEYLHAAELEEGQRFAREQERLNSTDAVDVVGEAEPAPRTRKRTPRPQSIPTACGRCHGQGVIEGGGGCPVCQGKGSISHYGKR